MEEKADCFKVCMHFQKGVKYLMFDVWFNFELVLKLHCENEVVTYWLLGVDI